MYMYYLRFKKVISSIIQVPSHRSYLEFSNLLLTIWIYIYVSKRASTSKNLSPRLTMFNVNVSQEVHLIDPHLLLAQVVKARDEEDW